MDLSFRFDPWIRRVPTSPRDVGTLLRIVTRVSGREGEREARERAHLSAAGGVEGDRWSHDPARDPDVQVSLINAHWLRALADSDDPARMDLSGDNLQVDLDLSEQNLPVGTRLAVGEAVLEVGPVPHRPCRSFHQRFGPLAAKRVARAGRLGLRGRGLLARVVRDGTVRVGDPVRVLGR